MGIHQYASAAGMSCATAVYMKAVESNLARISAPGGDTRLPNTSLRRRRMPRLRLRHTKVRTLDTTTIISNKEAEA